MNSEGLHAALRELYQSKIHDLKDLLAEKGTLSYPLLVKAPHEYSSAKTKLMVIGQETNGWAPANDQPIRENPQECMVDALLHLYEEFQLGRKQRRSPFWQAAHKLYRGLNPNSPANGFVWSNLIKVDLNGGRLTPELAKIWGERFDVLPEEVRILKPDVVVFFTGPHYDERLLQTFPDAELEAVPELRGLGVRVKHPKLPNRSYRLYHPKYLRISRNWSVLEALTDMCC